MSKLLYLIDTYSLVFQVFHGIPNMTSPKGEPTNAVFGFIRDIKQILSEKKPTHIILGLEGEGPGERVGLYDQYKANRSEMPLDLRPQIPRILQVAEGLGIPTFRHDGWEADDVIATLARQAVEDGFQVRIVTSDKDARQLINEKVKLYNCRKTRFSMRNSCSMTGVFGQIRSPIFRAWSVIPAITFRGCPKSVLKRRPNCCRSGARWRRFWNMPRRWNERWFERTW